MSHLTKSALKEIARIVRANLKNAGYTNRTISVSVDSRRVNVTIKDTHNETKPLSQEVLEETALKDLCPSTKDYIRFQWAGGVLDVFSESWEEILGGFTENQTKIYGQLKITKTPSVFLIQDMGGEVRRGKPQVQSYPLPFRKSAATKISILHLQNDYHRN